MIDLKQSIGLIAVVISIFALFPYVFDILKKKTKPHFYSWVIWTPLTFIAFFSQLSDNAGAGAWTTGVTAVLCLLILALSVKYGTKDITKSDKILLVGVIISSGLFFIVKDVLLSILLVTFIDVAAFYPTIRKSIKKPREETLSTHTLAGIKHFISLFALDKVSVITAIYPAAVFIANVVLVAVMIRGRKR
jgi:hypothetical protein